MRKTGSLIVAALFAALVLVANGSAHRTRAQAGGTMVIGLEQEPGILNVALATAIVVAQPRPATAPSHAVPHSAMHAIDITPDVSLSGRWVAVAGRG